MFNNVAASNIILAPSFFYLAFDLHQNHHLKNHKAHYLDRISHPEIPYFHQKILF